MAIRHVWDVLVVLYLRCDRKILGMRNRLPSLRVQPVFNHGLLVNTRQGIKPNLCISKVDVDVDVVAVVGVVTGLISQARATVEALHEFDGHNIDIECSTIFKIYLQQVRTGPVVLQLRLALVQLLRSK